MSIALAGAVLLAAITLLGGCATQIKDAPGGRWVGVEPGGTLTLNRPIRVPQGRARVWLVNGRLSRTSASYRTACALELRDLARDGPHGIPAGAARITRVQNYWTEVVAVPAADLVRFRLADYGSAGDTGYSMIRTGFHFWLEHPADPSLYRMTCLGVLADPPDSYPPSLAEIGEALGTLATLEPVIDGSR
jgi:hypothetical protein